MFVWLVVCVPKCCADLGHQTGAMPGTVGNFTGKQMPVLVDFVECMTADI